MNDSELRVSVPDSAIPNDTNDQPTTRANSGDIGNEPGPIPDAQGGEVDVGGTVGVGPGTEEISAYFKLESALFTYYCQTLVVTIGRRPPIASKADPQASGPSGEPDQDGLLPPHEILTLGGPSSAGKSEGEASGVNGSGNTASSVVDVDLGQLKSVSRLHARIEYDETEACFVLAVLGRNGAWVDGEWYGGGRKAPLTARSRIQIATRVFYFVLPDTAPPRSPSPDSQCTRHSHSRTHSRSRSRTRSPDGSISVIRNTPPRQRSPSVDIMSVASAESGDETQWVDVEPPPEPVPAKGARKPPAGKGVGKGKGRDKAPAKDKGNQLDVAPTRGKGGHGKGKGKAATASRDPKRKQPDPEPSTSKSVPVASKAPSKSITAIKGTPAHLPTPDSGTEPLPQRPAITFATHCYHAIRALGGRATLAEICQWMREQYEWFTSAEGLATNWESSVRHNLSSNKAFVAHKRKEGEKGKGFYWTFDPACEASFLERERKVRPTPNQSTSAQSQTQPPAPPLLLADDGTDVSIDVEAEEEDIRGTGPPKRIDTSSIIDEAKRRRAEKEERRRLKAEKRERRERREKERAMKAAKRLAAAGGPSIAPTGQPPFFFPPYGQPYPFPPFVPPQPDGENGAPPPAPFMMKGPDGQMVPMPMPPPYMVPGPDGQMVPMPMPPYMMGAPPMGGKDGKPENGQPPFMVKGPDGQMVPAPVPPYGFPPYGYPYYLPQGPYWMPYAAPDGKKGAGGSPTVIKREDLDEEKTVSPQPHAPPWTMPPGMMPYPPPPHMGMPPFGTPAPTLGTSGEVPPAASQVPAMNMAAPTPTALAPPGPPTLSTSPAPMSLPSPALGLSTTSAPALTPTPGPTVPVAGPSSGAGAGLDAVPMTGLSPEAPTVTVSPALVSTPAPATSTPVPPSSVSVFTPTTAPTPSAPSTPAISTPVASTSTPASVSVSAPAPAPAPTLALTPAPTSTSAPTPTPDLSKVSIPIVVAPLPASYVPPPGSTPAPYMVLHEQKLWLSPEVFSKLTEERLAELRKMGMREVINTLQADIVQFLKDKMRSGSGARGRGRGRGRARGGGVTPRPPATASSAPTTASPAPAEASPIAAPNIGAAEPASNGSPVNGQGTPSPNEVGPSNQSPKLSGPAPNVDGTHTTDGSGSHTAHTAHTALTAGTSTGIVRAREGDDEVAPEPKKFKSDVVGTV